MKLTRIARPSGHAVRKERFRLWERLLLVGGGARARRHDGQLPRQALGAEFSDAVSGHRPRF